MKRWDKSETSYKSALDHYDEAYFVDQTRDGDLRGVANAWKFASYVKPGQKICDFGCGNGALLKALGGSYGVEVNPHSAAAARARGLEVRSELREFEENSFDVVISNHCLEHTENPLEHLREIRRVLRENGTIAICVPCHRPNYPFREKDRDFHLFSWSANNLGNLVQLAGFEVREARELRHRWPPKWQSILRKGGPRPFHILSRLWAALDRTASQVMVVGRPRTEGP